MYTQTHIHTHTNNHTQPTQNTHTYTYVYLMKGDIVGCGLGMVSILLDKMDVCESILATDGDDDTIKLLEENVLSTGASFLDCIVHLIGLDWIGLDWIGLDWIGLDWIGLDWIRLD